MPLKKTGMVKAFIPGSNGKKANYVTIGVLFEDEELRPVIKIDSLPLPGVPWEGWINIFLDGDTTRPKRRREEPGGSDDDIPF